MENGPFEDAFPIENCDIPASYVSLPEDIWRIFFEKIHPFKNHSGKNRSLPTICPVREWNYFCGYDGDS